MPRVVTLLIVFFVSLNLFAGAFMTTGLADTMGIDADVGEDEAVDQRTGNRDVQGGTGTGSTLADLRNALGSQLADLFGVIFPGLRMLGRAGVPEWIIGGILGPLFSVFTTILVLAFFRGWDL